MVFCSATVLLAVVVTICVCISVVKTICIKAVYITAVWKKAWTWCCLLCLCYSASHGLEQKREAYTALYLMQKNVFSNFVKYFLASLEKLSYYSQL